MENEAADFGALLLQRGLITPRDLDEAIRIQREHQLAGREPMPRLGEILVERGLLTERQVADVLAAQQKEILHCPRCQVQVNVPARPGAVYRCSRCEGPLERPSEVRDVKVVDSSLILVSRERLPDEVREASRDPSRKFGKYLLLEEIGRGGLAVIHRAWDTYLNQFVALKFVKPQAGAAPDTPEARTRHESRILDLMKEARSAVRLRHPHIVPVYDVGKIAHQFYIAMELLEGATLAELVRRAREQGKISPFYDDPKRYLGYVRDVARAAHYAHTRPTPVVHCDLKPSNVFVASSGRATVLDFGLARELRETGRRSGETQVMVRGTPAYMAPEQASGHAEDIDARTDVYGVGAILYELLSGRPPFTGDLGSVLHKAISSMPDRPSDIVPAPGRGIPESLERICLKCLEKDRDLRYATARDVAEDVDRVIRGEASRASTHARPAPKPPPKPPAAPAPAPAPRRGALPLAAGLAAVCAALLAAGLALGRRGPGELEEVRSRVEGLLAAMRTEEADRAYLAAAKAVDSAEARDWIEGERAEVEWMAQLKAALVEAANSRRSAHARFRTRGGELREVEVLRATPEKLVLFSGGRALELRWEGVHPGQVRELARELLGPSPPAGARMGLGLLCLKNGMAAEAREAFASLGETELAPVARRYLARLGQ